MQCHFFLICDTWRYMSFQTPHPIRNLIAPNVCISQASKILQHQPSRSQESKLVLITTRNWTYLGARRWSNSLVEAERGPAWRSRISCRRIQSNLIQLMTEAISMLRRSNNTVENVGGVAELFKTKHMFQTISVPQLFDAAIWQGVKQLYRSIDNSCRT